MIKRWGQGDSRLPLPPYKHIFNPKSTPNQSDRCWGVLWYNHFFLHPNRNKKSIPENINLKLFFSAATLGLKSSSFHPIGTDTAEASSYCILTNNSFDLNKRMPGNLEITKHLYQSWMEDVFCKVLSGWSVDPCYALRILSCYVQTGCPVDRIHTATDWFGYRALH